MKLGRIWKFVDENRFLDETYFILLSVILAFGILQTTGTALETDKPVVTVISTSMCPNLQVGDILVVQNQDFSDIKEEDIVVYDVPDTAEITVGGEKYTLRAFDDEPRPSVNTSMGTVELVDVQPNNRDRDQDSVVLRINGEIPDVGGEKTALREEETYMIDGEEIQIGYLTDLPQAGVPIVHRVADKQDEYLETIGDNNPSQLEFERNIQADQIHGKVLFKIPRLGLVKILGMDLVGYSGDAPLEIDNTPTCGR